MKLFVVNIGNTNTQYGIFDRGRVGRVRTCPTSHPRGNIFPKGMPAAVSTVVPAFRKKFHGRDIFWIEPFRNGLVDFNRVDSSTLGADRVANCYALAEYAELPGIVIDCGTAITVDAVDKNRVFRGGAILPGRMMARRALHEFTAQIPLFGISEKKPKALGRDTRGAVLGGIDLGLVGAIEKIIEAAKHEMRAKSCAIVVAGGDSGFFSRSLGGTVRQAGGDFTLRGIAAIWKFFHPDA